MTDIVTLFTQQYTDFGIVAGDFNCCLDSNLDKSLLMSNPKASKALNVASDDAGLENLTLQLETTLFIQLDTKHTLGWTFYFCPRTTSLLSSHVA